MATGSANTVITNFELNQSLWLACLDGDIPKVNQFIHEGADLSYKGPGGKSPLAIAAYQDHGELVELLVDKYNADPEAPDEQGNTALYWACSQENVSAVQALVNCGAIIESQTKSGATPFLVCCNVGNMEMVRLLISNRANRHLVYNSITPKQLAQRENHSDVVDYLSQVEKYENPLKNAIAEEFVEIVITKFSIHGPAGSGKTCLQHLMLNESVPVRESTDLVTDTMLASFRDISTTVMANVQSLASDKATPSGMTRVKGDSSLELLKQETKSKLQLDSDESSMAEDPQPSGATPGVSSQEKESTTSKKKSKGWKKCLKPPFLKKKSHQPPPVREIQCDFSQRQLNKSFTSCGLLSILPATEASDTSVTLRWIYGTDSGGQPAFQDVAPAFLRHCSIVILTLKLNERLDDYPKLEYMHKEKLVNQGSRKQLTNLQMVLNLARSLSSVLQPRCENMSVCHPKLLIIGTFDDQKHLCSESLEEKNERLKKELKPFTNVFIPTANGDPIHPVCTIVKPEEGREECSQKLCRTFLDCLGGKHTLKIRLSHLMFQFEIFMYAESKKKEILHLDECYEVGRSVQINDRESVIEALKYLDNIGVIFYFGEVLPNIVFIKPQLILKRLSDLVSFSFFENMQLFPEYASLPLNLHQNLRIDGCVSKALLQVLFPHQRETLFPVEDFIALLKYFFIIAEVPSPNCNYYFLPCVLPWDDHIHEKIISLMRPIADPILLAWELRYEKPIVPYGMFLGTINALLSFEDDLQFKLLSNAVDDTVFKHQRNAVFLECGGGYLLLVDKIFYIELRYKGDTSVCPKILKAVKSCITEAAKRFHYHQDLGMVTERFMSKCAMEAEDHDFNLCSGTGKNKMCKKHGETKKLSYSELVWFESNIPLEAMTDISDLLPLTRELENSDLHKIHKVLKPISYKWMEVGSKLGLQHYELRAIECGCKDDVSRCLLDMIDKWIRIGVESECTTEKLKTVLEEMNVKVTP